MATVCLEPEDKEGIATGSLLGAEAKADINTGNLLAAEAEADITTGSLLASLATNALPRLLTPLVDINFSMGCYAQCGQPVSFNDLFTYTRGSLGTFINREPKCTGGWNYFVDTAAINDLRFEFDPETGEALGALIEGGSTNLSLRSEEFDNGAWGKTGGSVSADVISSPDNTINADKFTQDASSGVHQLATSVTGVVIGNSYSTSFYAKMGESRHFQLFFTGAAFDGLNYANFDLILGTVTASDIVTASIKSLGNGWFRCSISAVATATSAGGQAFALIADSPTMSRGGAYTGDNTSGLFIWGAQFEELPFASSYIKTEGSTVSRSADDLTLPSADNFNVDKYSVNVEYDFLGDSVDAAHAFAVSDGTTDNRFLIKIISSAPFWLGSSGGTTDINDSGSALIKNTLIKQVSTFTPNDFIGYTNSVVDVTDGSCVPMVADTVIGIGNLNSGFYLYGHISKFATYDKVLTATEVASL